MSQFYDQASLVMIPSGYKAGKVYSQKPLTTDGQLTFTRTGDTATRVNADGLVEKVRTNLLLQSNQFDTTWTTTSTSVTSGQSGYDGTNDAWKLTKSAASGRLQQGTFSAGVYSFSVYLKADTNNWVQLYLDSTTATDPNCFFDLENGTVGTGTNNIDATIKSVGNGWYRCSVIGNVGTTFSAMIFPAEADNDKSASSGSIYIQDAQLETGDIATDYIPTTTAAVSVGPVANLPRIDYTGGGCGKLLLEPQRTNLVTYSEQFNNAAWTKQTGITITANTTETLDPSGYYGADKIVSTSGSTGFFQAGLSLTSDLVRSIYLKGAVGGEQVKIKDPSGYGGFTTHTLTTSWVRYEHKTTNTGDTYQGLFVDDITNGATIYAWGAQLEAGSYATSYIPTLSAAVTRGADAASKSDIAGTLPTAYPFTLYADFEVIIGNDEYSVCIINNLSGTNYYNIGINSSNKFAAISRPSTIQEYAVSTADATVGRHKICGIFTSSQIKLVVDGVLLDTASHTNAFNSAVNDLLLGQLRIISDLGKRNSINQALVFKSELTEAQAIELTTL